jgi:hypothetical protein
VKDGASRVSGGHLAGGGALLSDLYRVWLRTESKATGQAAKTLFRRTLRCLTTDPLLALGISPNALKHRKVRWTGLTA